MANEVTTPEELDALIKRWETNVAAINSNIALLRGTLCYELFKNHESPNGRKITGTTSEKVPAALAAVKRMDTNWARLQTVVAAARKAHGELPRWSQRKAIDAAAAKLTSEAIVLETREIPLSQRTATSGSVETITSTPQKLLDQVNADFQLAKTVLLAVDEAWTNLQPKIDAERAKVAELRKRFEDAGMADASEFTTLVTRFNALDTKYSCDPLGCPDDPAKSMRQYVNAAEAKLKAEEDRIRAEHDAVTARVEGIKERLEELKGMRLRALELYQQANVEIENPQGLQTPGSVKNLSEWVTILETAISQQRWQSVKEGSNDWYIEFNALRQSLQACIAANKAVCEKKDDLVRRWAAAKALYEQHKAALPESKSLGLFRQKAEEAMTGKIKLDDADVAVHAYEVKLGEMVARLGTTGT